MDKQNLNLIVSKLLLWTNTNQKIAKNENKDLVTIKTSKKDIDAHEHRLHEIEKKFLEQSGESINEKNCNKICT